MFWRCLDEQKNRDNIRALELASIPQHDVLTLARGELGGNTLHEIHV